MRIAVIGASGRTGQATVRHAIATGHEAVSVVRRPTAAPHGTIVRHADARDETALAAAIDGSDAVVSCLGHVSGDPDHETVLRDGMAALVRAMARTGATRLVAVSAAGAYVAGDDPLSRYVAKPILGRVLKTGFADTRAMEDVIRQSGLRWTILRPSRLITGDGTSDYRRRIDAAVRWHYSTRFDTVGRAAIDALADSAWIAHAVFITE